jgi:23S rRNA (uracil1939-C5)-methyltransferase
LILQIEKLVYGGEGLARLPVDEHGPGKTAFVPFVIPGEEVEASPIETRPGFVRAKLDKILMASPQRIERGCPYFGRCGGCHYQHINYDAQLRYKAEILRETLRRTAKLELVPDIQLHPSPPWSYRNRTRLRVRHTPEFALGYFRYNSHDVLPVESCPISSPLINQAIAAVWKLGRDGVVPQSVHGLQFFTNHDDTQLLAEVSVRPEGADQGLRQGTTSVVPYQGQRTLALAAEVLRPAPGKRTPSGAKARLLSAQTARLKSCPDTKLMGSDIQPFAAVLHAELPQVTGVIVFPTSALEDESQQRASLTAIHAESSQAFGDESLLYHAVGHDYRVSGGSFFQTNRFLTDTLVQIVIAGRKGRGALDLYAGAGLFTASLARNFDTVLAVESSPHSFADLRHNVPSNVKCIRSTTEKFLAERAAKLAPDLVVVDPPRAGLGEKAATALGRMTVPRVTYVSCDPATLSRDLRVLLEFNFRVEQAHLVDMFPQTFHMETVLHLAR